MPTTSNFGWTTPADTDLVKDGAAAIRTLGNGIDTSFLDLKGGTTGQVLAKASNTDLDFTWSAADPLSILDAKGDLISATAADTPARLAVGTDGQYLKADSSTATGLAWATVATGANSYPRLNANYYIWNNWTSSGNTSSLTEDTTYYTAIYLPACTISRIGMRTGSNFTATGVTTRLGLYNNGANNIPTTVLLDAGTVSPTTASTDYEITVSLTITTAGIYWTALNNQTQGAGTASVVGSAGSPLLHNNASSAGFTQVRGYTESAITGAYATAGTLTAIDSASMPFIQLRIN